ncbi:MAG: hypothetical protein PUE02_08860, partial [Eggerthellaceae bacterium]|nr:hypothetical protein [Eggerthellaceae bacterium]
MIFFFIGHIANRNKNQKWEDKNMPKKNKVYNCHEFAEDDPYRQYCKLWVVRSLLQENPGATMGDLRERIMQRAIDDLSLKDTLYILMGKSPKLAQYMNRELTDQAF